VVGIDYSSLALRIARSVSPPTCNYYLYSEIAQLEPLYGSFDCMVCRFFFIHQNYDSSRQLLELARRLLKPGGLVGADFYMPGTDTRPRVVFPARQRLSKQYPSCAFAFTMKEIQELAAQTGFALLEPWESPAEQRRFVLLARR
jgi:SAM-dependent methyltransferase